MATMNDKAMNDNAALLPVNSEPKVADLPEPEVEKRLRLMEDRLYRLEGTVDALAGDGSEGAEDALAAEASSTSSEEDSPPPSPAPRTEPPPAKKKEKKNKKKKKNKNAKNKKENKENIKENISKKLEDTVGLLASGNKVTRPPRSGADALIAAFIPSLDGAEDSPAAGVSDALPEGAAPPPSPAPRTEKPPVEKKNKKKKRKRKKKNEENKENKTTNSTKNNTLNKKKKTMRNKVARWALPSAVLCTMVLGQEIMKGDYSPLAREIAQKVEGGQAVAAALGERFQMVFGTAEDEGAEAGGAGRAADPARRTQEACVWCPDGLTVEPETLIPNGGGVTCAILESVTKTLPLGPLCSQVQRRQDTCCPADAAPASDDLPSTSPTSLAQRCPLADNQVCGCEIKSQADYQGTLSVPEGGGAQCLPWDSDIVMKFREDMLKFSAYPDGHFVENYCRTVGIVASRARCVIQVPGQDMSYAYCDVPVCDPCSCVPACGVPNRAPCGCPSVHQAETCCVGVADAASCKCGYLKEACRKSLEIGSTEFCALAAEECCAGNENPWCGCNVYQRICTENPFKSTCDFAAESCCNSGFNVADAYGIKSDGSNAVCKCEFFTYATNELGYDRIDNNTTEDICDQANTRQILSFESKIALATQRLNTIYTSTQGDYWFRNDGWASAAKDHGEGLWLEVGEEYCNWYGLTCDDRKLVTEINLSKNNLTGNIDWFRAFEFPDLVRLDISQNKVSGLVDNEFMAYLRKLEYLNISANEFSGHADVLLHPSLKSVDFSKNKFTTAGFRRFHESYHTLRELDLSVNHIAQDVSDIFLNIPPTLENCDMSNNKIEGVLPKEFPLEQVRFFVMTNNNLSGPLPDFPETSPKLERLDLANNCLTGTIHGSFWKLGDLSFMDLSGNKLSGGIPPSLGDLTQLSTLRLSSNSLGQSIPDKLGRLQGVSEVFDVSSNTFTGIIPSELGKFRGVVRLSGNAHFTNPAPLDLCLIEGFDSANDKRLCPTERTALSAFYTAAKGREWTKSENWTSQYTTHCSWYGVKCIDETVVNLTLASNGLSGTLSESIAELTNLSHLDLSDNDIKGNIPSEIGSLTLLTHLRLSYNVFIGMVPNEFQELSQLKMIQLNGNRLTGTIPLHVHVRLLPGESSFVSDCGAPSIYESPIVCESCTMCCNSLDNCYPRKKSRIQQAGFADYKHLSWSFFLILMGGCLFLYFASLFYSKCKNSTEATALDTQASAKVKRYASDTLGDDSIYRFILSAHWQGWALALVTLGAQLLILIQFINASELDLSDDNKDLVYSWKCPRDTHDCRSRYACDWLGWTAFALLMAAHLLKDIINGYKMIALSIQASHPPHKKIQYFFGGLVLLVISLFTMYASTIYNVGIATSNTELIENAVIILFVTDLDEMVDAILLAINPRWASNKEQDDEEQNDGEQDEEQGEDEHSKGDALALLTSEYLELKEKLRQIEGQVEVLVNFLKVEFKIKLPKSVKSLGRC